MIMKKSYKHERVVFAEKFRFLKKYISKPGYVGIDFQRFLEKDLDYFKEEWSFEHDSVLTTDEILQCFELHNVHVEYDDYDNSYIIYNHHVLLLDENRKKRMGSSHKYDDSQTFQIPNVNFVWGKWETVSCINSLDSIEIIYTYLFELEFKSSRIEMGMLLDGSVALNLVFEKYVITKKISLESISQFIILSDEEKRVLIDRTNPLGIQNWVYLFFYLYRFYITEIILVNSNSDFGQISLKEDIQNFKVLDFDKIIVKKL